MWERPPHAWVTAAPVRAGGGLPPPLASRTLKPGASPPRLWWPPRVRGAADPLLGPLAGCKHVAGTGFRQAMLEDGSNHRPVELRNRRRRGVVRHGARGGPGAAEMGESVDCPGF